MKMRILALLMALMMMVVLAACGGGGSGGAAGEADTSEQTGELLVFDSEGGGVTCTMKLPEGFEVVKSWNEGASMNISNGQGQFGLSILPAMIPPGKPEDKATQLGTLNIGGTECRLQASGDDSVLVEITGTIFASTHFYLHSRDFDMTEPEMVAMLDSITLTINE